jgi:hypothetical protein
MDSGTPTRASQPSRYLHAAARSGNGMMELRPLWGVGAKNERQAVHVAPIVGLQGGGFALGWRF